MPHTGFKGMDAFAKFQSTASFRMQIANAGADNYTFWKNLIFLSCQVSQLCGTCHASFYQSSASLARLDPFCNRAYTRARARQQ